MTKSTYTWYTVVALTLIGCCALAGLATIATGGYDFALTLSEEKLENKIITEIHIIKEIDCSGYRMGNGSYSFDGARGGRPANCRDPSNNDRLQSKGTHNYKLILILCLIAAMILGFVQFVGSTWVVCSCNGARLRSNIKGWLIANIFIFLLGLLCLLIPLSYDVSEEKHFSISGFSSYLKKKFRALVQVRDLEEAHQHLFFYVVGCNEALLLVTILLLTALLPCGTQPYESVYGG